MIEENSRRKSMKKVELVFGYEVLRQAERFKKAVSVLVSSEDMDAAIPAEVNACIACELYLKYLVYFRDNDKVAPDVLKSEIHSLAELFKKLLPDEKQEIMNQLEKSEDEIYSQLQAVGNNFVNVRYEYEYPEITYSFGFLNHLMIVLDSISVNKE